MGGVGVGGSNLGGRRGRPEQEGKEELESREDTGENLAGSFMILSGFTRKGDDTSLGFSAVIAALEGEGVASLWDLRADFLFSEGDEGVETAKVAEWLASTSALLLSLLSGILPGLSGLGEIQDTPDEILSSVEGVTFCNVSLLASLSFWGVRLPLSEPLCAVASLFTTTGLSVSKGILVVVCVVSAVSGSFTNPDDRSFCLVSTLLSTPDFFIFLVGLVSGAVFIVSTLSSSVVCVAMIGWNSARTGGEVELRERGDVTGGDEMGRGEGSIGMEVKERESEGEEMGRGDKSIF